MTTISIDKKFYLTNIFTFIQSYFFFLEIISAWSRFLNSTCSRANSFPITDVCDKIREREREYVYQYVNRRVIFKNTLVVVDFRL
jgi:hypothetical protein